MKYVSTRGQAPVVGFEDALLAGLAPDGGLYVPDAWPTLSTETIADFAGRPYAGVAKTVMQPFVEGAVEAEAFGAMVEEAYASFRHPAVAPLVQEGPNSWLMELHHGPTFAFKDVAMQLLGRLFEHVLTQKGRRMTVVGATSGDTGSAAIEALKGRAGIDIFILHPNGRVSDIQRRQMTTVSDANVHNIAVEGDFDDCQALVKALFADQPFREEQSLGGVNSINWARIMAQTVYYFTAATALGGPARPVAFTTPTGNFGDIFAGYVAKRMGLPIDKLIVATNENDILDRALTTGRYQKDVVQRTTSPSMDIQVSSNFERLMFDAYCREGDEVAQAMAQLKQSGGFDIPPAALTIMRAEFDSQRASEEEVAQAIRRSLQASGRVIDPHTAVGVVASEKYARTATSPAPIVTLSTAHPAKFGAAVAAATGEALVLPAPLAALSGLEERYDVLENDIGRLKAFITERTSL